MILDERVITDGISVRLLAKLIHKHECTRKDYSRLEQYYKGHYEIESRKLSSGALANNKIVCNHAKYIVRTSVAYLAGNPIKYDVSKGFDISAVENEYLEQDIQRTDYRLAKHMSIYGRAYELVYMGTSSESDAAGKLRSVPRSTVIDPRNAFVVYNDDCTSVPLFGVYYYRMRDIDGAVNGVVCNVYTDTQELTYEGKSDSWESMELTYKGELYFGGVPLIEYVNNDEKEGDFEQIIPLIDAYNTLQSDRVNDKSNFVDAFLFLKNIVIDGEQAEKLKKEKILMSNDSDSDARYLAKIMSESDIKVLRDDLKEDIHRLSMTPDLSDANFSNNLSGVAIKYKLMGFENHTKDKEGYFRTGLKKRFELYNHVLNIKSSVPIVPIHRIDIIFTHNMPANNLETSQMIANLGSSVTQETAIAQLDFVSDPKEEAELARGQAAQSYAEKVSAVEGIAQGGGHRWG